MPACGRRRAVRGWPGSRNPTATHCRSRSSRSELFCQDSRMSDEELLFERRGAVAWVTLSRPEVRNALTPDMRNRLIEVVEEIGADPELRCLVITGAGEGFCTGADIRGASSRQSGGSGSGERTAGAARDVIVNGVQRLFR